ncbi:hypothetical protein CWI36_0066p0050 [Hamiltosporidium magnivora]|uniref:Uncharacterized protein n=1 Tax=Hamiltosporidium magnivora TaxID=148818 RepID=A0A4Q9LLF2_9MICR|nr:hypothetical protein CWI36_0066p0050 [Hamiltosporidium magnivora]
MDINSDFFAKIAMWNFLIYVIEGIILYESSSFITKGLDIHGVSILEFEFSILYNYFYLFFCLARIFNEYSVSEILILYLIETYVILAKLTYYMTVNIGYIKYLQLIVNLLFYATLYKNLPGVYDTIIWRYYRYLGANSDIKNAFLVSFYLIRFAKLWKVSGFIL